MGWWFLLGADLLLTGYAVWLLLTAYRVVGKPAGADEKYDAWHRQWAGTLSRYFGESLDVCPDCEPRVLALLRPEPKPADGASRANPGRE